MMLKAVVFDLDGVITDTAHLHFLAWRAVAEEIGITFDEVFNEQLKGISRMDSLQRILKHGGKEGMFSDEQCLALATKKNALYVQSLASLTEDSLLPGIRDVLADIRAAKVKIGLASVSLNAPGILHALGIHQAFDFCADASRIRRSKPDPEIFLAACAGLNVRPEAAIGIEDALRALRRSTRRDAVGWDWPGLNHAGLQLHSTQELTWKCLTEFWASRTY
jgi:beta-phosphoglucomutase